MIVRDLVAKTSVDAGPSESDTIVISRDGKALATFDKTGISLHPIAGGDARQIRIGESIRRLWEWVRPTLITASTNSTGVIGHSAQNASDGRVVAVAVNVETSKVLTILDSPSSRYLGHARLSPDGRWMALMDWFSADRARVIVVPYDGVTTATMSQVIPITDGQTVAEETVWSADGNTLYLVSETDGYRCVWSRRVDPRTIQPMGPLTAVAHFHRARQQIVSTVASAQRIDISPAGLIFAMDERRGNIWMATVKR